VSLKSCPQSECLHALLNGTLLQDEQDELTRHLDDCAACQQRLERLAARSPVWPEAAREMVQENTDLDPELRRVMDELRGPGDAERSSAACAVDDGLLMSFLSPPALPGELGRLAEYRVTEVIGRGGMGIVLKAFDPSLHRFVAVKVLAPQLATSAAARIRFAREARAAAAVSHEHVVAIHAVSEAGGLPYLVMEYVPGMSLQERLDRHGPLELKEILRIGMQTAAALGAAHAQGLIHRDVKPANILLENGVERVKITDFGLARTVDDASLTQSGVLAGTPHYMAPEQARGEPMDCRADLFSLGSVLYALCTGRPPFRAGTTLAVLRRVSEESPRSVREINPDIPVWLADLIAQLHAQDPARRFQSAAEVAELLAQYLAHVQEPRVRPLPRWRHVSDSSVAPATPRKRAWALPLAVLAVVIGLLALSRADTVLLNLRRLAGALNLRGPEATLMLELDDPDMQAVLEGEEDDIHLQGAGWHQVDVKSGKHRLRCLKDGSVVHSDVFTVERGNVRQIKLTRDALGAGRALLLDQGSEVWCVAFSPDDRMLAAGSGLETEPGELRIWDLTTGRAKAVVGSARGVRSVAYSPDGEMLATGEFDDTAKLRDPQTGRVRATLYAHKGGVNGVAFSPDGALLATAGLDNQVKLWDVATCRERFTLRGHDQWVLSLAFSPDGETLVTGSADHTAKLWNVATGQERAILPGHQNWVEYVTVDPGGKLVATASWDSTVKFWDLETAEELSTLPAQMAEIFCARFSPSGKLLTTAGRDGSVRIWEVATQKLLASLPAHNNKVYGLAYSSDGKSLATASFDSTIKVWDLTKPLPRATDLTVGRSEVHRAGENPLLPPPAPQAIDGRTEPAGDLREVPTTTPPSTPAGLVTQ
jgi:WD40 repeat protein/serine/threonine protein kinase